MSKSPKLSEVMTTAPIVIEPAEYLDQAERIMSRERVRHLPVVEGGRLVGLLSDRDLKLALGSQRAEVEELTVADVARPDPYRVEGGAALADVLDQMAERRLGSVVVCAGERVVGVFTATDACRLLARRLRHDE
jgi:acetoin utilization protein AcuB